MKHKILALLLALTLASSLSVSASAVSQEHEVPVTLTIVNTEQKISVTVPAALPVSVVNGDVITATNATIRNTAERGTIRVTAVEVPPGHSPLGTTRTSTSGWRPSPCPSTAVPPGPPGP